LNVFDAPAASDEANVNVHSFDFVAADDPLPLRGLNVAPDGTESFVQWSPLGIPKETANPFHEECPVFWTVIVPHMFGPSYVFVATFAVQVPMSDSGSEVARGSPTPALHAAPKASPSSAVPADRRARGERRSMRTPSATTMPYRWAPKIAARPQSAGLLRSGNRTRQRPHG
jgi:hypothetical protein